MLLVSTPQRLTIFSVMLKKLSTNRIFRFLICGAVTAAFNILLIAVIIEFLKLEQPVTRNIANVISIEVSLLFTFFVYKTWVWPQGTWTFQEVFYKQIPLYHLSSSFSVVTRTIILFPILDWLDVNYTINTLIGILAGASVNYVISDRWVFKAK